MIKYQQEEVSLIELCVSKNMKKQLLFLLNKNLGIAIKDDEMAKIKVALNCDDLYELIDNSEKEFSKLFDDV